MDPFIKQITQSNVALDRPLSEMEGFVNIIGKGNELVGKCSKYTRTTNETQILVKEIYANTTGRTQMSNDLVNNTQTGIKGSCRALEPPAFTVGLEKPFEELKMKLLRDDKPTVTTVVTAPPGCGKTTLAKRICKDDQIKGTFKSNILFVTVSKNPNLDLIVQELYEHKGYPVPTFEDNKNAEFRLELFLKEIGKERILLFLDDVWRGSESLVEKFVSEVPESDYKILVTSRFPIPRFEHPLKPLSDKEAMDIFQHCDSLEHGTLDIPDDTVEKVVGHCKRIPLALKLIGSSLRGKHLRIWLRELEKWSTDSSILNSEGELLSASKES
ncbi:NB-ARC domain containing protein [Parasponia andersonii]|uniref:NB-ARC domain containing protein n=1 Tax=Parasponia andersonii TaxID=3476 RepID=A0A2P5ADI3_PARAD|nr:NB-ARC domain containing protein [Parasponia andersonii]